MGKDIAIFVYYGGVDDNMLCTCIKSLRKVNPECTICIQYTSLPEGFCRPRCLCDLSPIARAAVKGRRALAKIEFINDILNSKVYLTDRIMVADVDTLFLSDPFAAFDEMSFDVGLTTRCHEYYFPINAGVFFLQVSVRVGDFMEWHLSESHSPVWAPYIQHRQKFDHERFGHDWTVGQDFLNVVWQKREYVQKEFDIKIEDVGYKYNYCPNLDVYGEAACVMIREAYERKLYSVLHLKSGLKRLLYDGVFEEGVFVTEPQLDFHWRNYGK